MRMIYIFNTHLKSTITPTFRKQECEIKGHKNVINTKGTRWKIRNQNNKN